MILKNNTGQRNNIHLHTNHNNIVGYPAYAIQKRYLFYSTMMLTMHKKKKKQPLMCTHQRLRQKRLETDLYRVVYNQNILHLM